MDAQTAVNVTSTYIPELNFMISSSALFIMALIPIYFGSIQSTKSKGEDHISTHDAAKFPIIASIALFSLFIIFKYIDQQYIDPVARCVFSFFGTISLARFLAEPLRMLYPNSLPNYELNISTLVKNLASNETVDENSIKIQCKDLPGIIIGVIIGAIYFASRHWLTNNCIALTMATVAVEQIRLSKVVNGCLLLSGLFIYDIFWVFGTNVMVTVATKFEAPIKIVFPRAFVQDTIFGKDMSMLGLGDIVIPGIFVALMLRLDLSMGSRKKYFLTTFMAYAIGLLFTFGVMHVFKHAQPALLYLVPTCLGFPLGLALVSGDLKTMFCYTDATEDDEENTDDGEKKEAVINGGDASPLEAKKRD